MDAPGSRTSVTVGSRNAKRRGRAVAAVVLGLTVQGASSPQTVWADVPPHWLQFLHVPGVVDLSAPRRDGSLTITAGGQLFLFQPSGTTEGGADTIAVRCRRTCTVRRCADGPAVSHAEGHIVFVRVARGSAARAARY
jgi:hypothetical protein